MLFIVFRLRNDRYALAADDIVEVLPALNLKALPGTPLSVAGLCNYRGRPVPVIDLGALALGERTPWCWGTRLLVVRYPHRSSVDHLIGLVVEDATQVVDLEASQFTDPGVRNDGAPYLGPVAHSPDGLVQRVEVRSLLPQDLREALFASVEEASR